MADLVDDLKTALLATSEHFETLIRRCIRAELLDLRAHGDPDSFLDASQAAVLLGMTPAALRRAAERGTFPVPPTRLGRRLRWRRGDIVALLDSSQTKRASRQRPPKAIGQTAKPLGAAKQAQLSYVPCDEIGP